MKQSLQGLDEISLEQSLKAVFEFNPIPHLILAPDSPSYTILAANSAYTAATNTNKEAILGRSLFDVFPPVHNIPHEDPLFTSLNKVVENKTPHQIESHEYQLPVDTEKPDHKGQYWNLVNIPVISNTGNVAFIIQTVVDVTDRMIHLKNLEKQKDNDRLQRDLMYNLFRKAPVAIALLSGKDFTVEIANVAMCKLWGREMENILGQSLFEALPESADEGLEELLENVRMTGIPYIGVEMPSTVVRDGKPQVVFFNFIYQPLRERDGNFEKILVISTEVLEQATAKTDLQKSKEHFSLALDFANIGVWEYDYFTKKSSYSEIANKLFGYTANEDWTRKKFLQHIVDEDLDRVQKIMERSLETGMLEMDFRVLRSDGTLRWLSMQGKNLYDSKKQPVRMLGLLSDITDRKNSELQKDEFMGVVSHELKTPVTSLKAYGQILQTKFLEAGDLESAEFLAKMDTQVNKLTSLIGDLLDATRIEGGQLVLYKEDFSTSALINDIIEEVQRTTTKHVIRRSDNHDCLLSGDRERIGQVLTNLLTNAVKYSPDQKEIIVSSLVYPHEFRCCVTDFGMGIPLENRTKIFDRYFRIYSEKRRTYPGLGLGLYISSEIIKRQNGKIWVESEEGKGSTFCFSLPRIEA